jgi:uncharacterized membrane protein (UPF0127 family)
MSTNRFTNALRLAVVAIASCAWLSAGCKPDQPSSTAATQPTSTGSDSRLPTTRMTLGSETFILEIAYSRDEQEVGLMNRRSMPANHGMIFVNNDERERMFWMKDTYIPLDIIFLSHDGHVVSVKHMKPLDQSTVPSDGPAMYAIELNAGAAERAGVKAGDVLRIPDELRVP